VKRKDPMQIIDARQLSTIAAASKVRSKDAIPLKVTSVVQRILKDVEAQGNTALLNYTRKLDGAELTSDTLKVTSQEIKEAYRNVSNEQISAIQFAKRRVEQFEQAVMNSLKPLQIEDNGVKIDQKIIPINSVGCYVPGGRASYPSSLLMTVIPAKIAGVKRIVVTSPPTKDGAIPSLLLVAADICEVNEFYKAGGAQAIAALAYGTGTVKPVEKIVGPGNTYVTAAKQLVSSVVATDLPAGPSEILILADSSANPDFIVRDLLSQAEHGPDSICGVATDSPDLALKISNLLGELLSNVDRPEIVNASLSKGGFIVLCQNIDQIVEFANLFAPEHLEVMTEKPARTAERITSAGLVLLGSYSPVAASDYCIGTNHVLPTGGSARRSSGLSSLDFIRRMDIVNCSKQGLQALRGPASLLASSEGLSNHASAVNERFRGESN
jgi:histidinol dehydrogenase